MPVLPQLFSFLFFADPSAFPAFGILPLLLVFAIFYFLLILPVQRRQRRTQEMQRQLKNGDRVITTGGIRGTVVSIKDDAIHVRVPPDQIKLELLRSAVASVEPETGGAKSAKP